MMDEIVHELTLMNTTLDSLSHSLEEMVVLLKAIYGTTQQISDQLAELQADLQYLLLKPHSE